MRIPCILAGVTCPQDVVDVVHVPAGDALALPQLHFVARRRVRVLAVNPPPVLVILRRSNAP